MAFMGWTSLGNGRFQAPDFGNFQIIEEGSDWIRLDCGALLYVGGLDESLYFIGYLPHTHAGWVLFPVGGWPFVFSIESQSWCWIAPGGQWLWNFTLRRWLGN